MKEPVTKTTPDIEQEQIAKLQRLFPYVVTETEEGLKVDFEQLRATLGDAVAQEEHYTFTWAGKGDLFRAIQEPSAATLVPARDESVNWGKTGHLFIEGENLEVLKLLYKSYHGRVKMIYIDPPYNTGNDFIYRDDFSEPKRAYLERTGQVDAEGNRLQSNTEAGGRYHTNWLNMIYPRLFLARQLLREDGVIFVSIGDSEVHHLRMVMNEVFGEQNFIASIVWQKKQSPQNDAINFSTMHDYILVYARRAKLSRSDSHGWERQLLPRTSEQDRRYSNPDSDERGDWASVDYTCNKTAAERPNLYYPIVNPNTGEEVWPSRSRVWLFDKEATERNLAEDRIWWGINDDGFPRLKRFLSEVADGIVPSTWWDRKFAGDNQQARRELRNLFNEVEDAFDTPKPTQLLHRILQISTSPDDKAIVLDFFAGSATMAQATLELNREDEGNRRFILVQYPEKTDKPELPTIADIAKERIRRVIKQMRLGEGTLPLDHGEDLGFRVYKLAPSNFQTWPGVEKADDLAQQLELFAGGVRPEAERDAIRTELILKEGLALTADAEAVAMDADNQVERVSDGRTTFYLCLDATISQETVDALPGAIPDLNPDSPIPFICADNALGDSQKANLSLQCRLKTF